MQLGASTTHLSNQTSCIASNSARWTLFFLSGIFVEYVSLFHSWCLSGCWFSIHGLCDLNGKLDSIKYQIYYLCQMIWSITLWYFNQMQYSDPTSHSNNSLTQLSFLQFHLCNCRWICFITHPNPHFHERPSIHNIQFKTFICWWLHCTFFNYIS